MKCSTSWWLRLSVIIACLVGGQCRAQVTPSGFGYQGVLRQGTEPANGIYEIKFRLYDAVTNGSLVSPELVETAVPVSNGVFGVTLDFGDRAFTGQARWIELAVRDTSKTNPVKVLYPRHEIRPVPYATYSFAAPLAPNSVSNAQLSADSVNTVNLAAGVVTGSKLASNTVVRSVNGLADNLTLSAGPGLTLHFVGSNTLQFASSVVDPFDYTTNVVQVLAGSNSLAGAHWQYPDTYVNTIVGWGSAIGRIPRIDGLGFWIKPLSNAAISLVDLQIRLDSATGPVQAHKQMAISASSHTVGVYVDWTLDTPVLNANSNVLFFHYIADGRANVMVPTAPSFAYPSNQVPGVFFIDGATNHLSSLASDPDSLDARYRGVWFGTPTNNFCVFVTWSTNTGETVITRSPAWTNLMTSILSNAMPPVVLSLSNSLAATLNQQASALSNALALAISNRLTASRIILPQEFVAVVGDKLQLYLRGMIECQNPYSIPTEITCPVGATYPRYFEITPTLDQVGSHPLTVSVLDDAGNVVNSESANLRIVRAQAQPSTLVHVLCVGDSLTAGGQWPQEFYRRLTQTGGSPPGLGYGNISFIGDTPTESFPTQRFIGNPGWTWDHYMSTNGDAAWVVCTHDKDASDQKAIYRDANGNQWVIQTIELERVKMVHLPIYASGYTMPAAPNTLTWLNGGTHHASLNYNDWLPDSTSPFVTGTNFSFSQFCSAHGYSTIDVMYVLLGWNGLPGQNLADPTNHSYTIGRARAFIDSFHQEFPAAQVRLVGIQVPSVSGGLGTNYGATGTYSQYYRLLRTANGLRLAYKALASDASYSGFVKFIDIAPQFDSENNMQQVAMPVNTRNSTTELRGANGVHPDLPGYLQIADAVWRDFIRTFCSQ